MGNNWNAFFKTIKLTHLKEKWWKHIYIYKYTIYDQSLYFWCKFLFPNGKLCIKWKRCTQIIFCSMDFSLSEQSCESFFLFRCNAIRLYNIPIFIRVHRSFQFWSVNFRLQRCHRYHETVRKAHYLCTSLTRIGFFRRSFSFHIIYKTLQQTQKCITLRKLSFFLVIFQK